MLSDRIGVMVNGEFLAVDTSLGLKIKFGQGYKFSFLTSKNDMDKVINLSQSIIPQLKVIHQKGGSIIMALSTNELHDMMENQDIKQFFELMKSDRSEIRFNNQKLSELSKLIYNWGISQTSLEEVFIAINNSESTAHKNF